MVVGKVKSGMEKYISATYKERIAIGEINLDGVIALIELKLDRNPEIIVYEEGANIVFGVSLSKVSASLVRVEYFKTQHAESFLDIQGIEIKDRWFYEKDFKEKYRQVFRPYEDWLENKLGSLKFELQDGEYQTFSNRKIMPRMVLNTKNDTLWYIENQYVSSSRSGHREFPVADFHPRIHGVNSLIKTPWKFIQSEKFSVGKNKMDTRILPSKKEVPLWRFNTEPGY